MTREYHLVPANEEETFQGETLKQAKKYWWDRFPVYERSDGCIMYAESEEYRDSVLEQGAEDDVCISAILIALTPLKITFETYGTLRDMEIFRFAQWLEKIQPLRVLDETERPMTMEALRENLGAGGAT